MVRSYKEELLRHRLILPKSHATNYSFSARGRLPPFSQGSSDTSLSQSCSLLQVTETDRCVVPNLTRREAQYWAMGCPIRHSTHSPQVSRTGKPTSSVRGDWKDTLGTGFIWLLLIVISLNNCGTFYWIMWDVSEIWIMCLCYALMVRVLGTRMQCGYLRQRSHSVDRGMLTSLEVSTYHSFHLGWFQKCVWYTNKCT